VRPGSIALAVALATAAVVRRSQLSTAMRIVVVLAVAGLAVSGSGLVELPRAEALLREVTGRLGSLTYVVVGALAFAETGAFLGLVAPGELAVVLGGVSAGHGAVSLPVLVALVWACAFSGDLVSYVLGRRLGRGFLLRHGAAVGISEQRLAQMERLLAAHGGKTIVLGRFVGFVRPLAPFVIGASRVPARTFVPLSALASGVWSATFACLGYAFSESLDELLALVERASLALGLSVVAGIAVAVVVRRRADASGAGGAAGPAADDGGSAAATARGAGACATGRPSASR
jgi:undecaprenyl-diphosphatase